jgi:hypothetical protein
MSGRVIDRDRIEPASRQCHYSDPVIPTGGKQILEISVKRYVAAISGAYNHDLSHENVRSEP